MSEGKFYVYVLARPDGRPFYVGKGQGNRVFNHEAEAKRNCHCKKCNIIRKIWKSGGVLQRYIVFHTDDEQEAFGHEKELIALYGRRSLANQTDGGEGLSGVSPSSTTLAKRSASLRARWADPALRAKVSAGAKARLSDPERRKHASITSKAAWADPEQRARYKTALAPSYTDPVRRAKLSASATARYTDPEERAQAAATTKAKWADEEHRSKMLVRMKEAANTPEHRATMRAASKIRYADPAARAKMSVAIKAMWARRKAAQQSEDES